ncbi:hypothetical protein ACCT09_44175, partial [Rhizobium ruizarguesonis]
FVGSTTRCSKALSDISPFKLRSSRAIYKPLKDKTNNNALTPGGDRSIFCFNGICQGNAAKRCLKNVPTRTEKREKSLC